MTNDCCGQESYPSGKPAKNTKQELIDQIKSLIGEIEKGGGGGKKARGKGPGGLRPGVEDECRQYRKRKGCDPPLITTLGVHEHRPTSNIAKMQAENRPQLTFFDAAPPDQFDPMPPAPWDLPRTPSQELRAGIMYKECDCLKRNGLQYDCPRWDCNGRPECVAVNPGPCCVASGARKPHRGDRRQQQNSSDPCVEPTPSTHPAGPKPWTGPEPNTRPLTGQPDLGMNIVCVCQVKPSAPTPSPPPQHSRSPVIGIITMNQASCSGNRTAPSAPAEHVCQQSTGPQHPEQQFVAVSPEGVKYLCCPLP